MKLPLAILTHEFFPKRGGIAIYAEETARAAAKLGWQTEVWAPENPRLAEIDLPFSVKQLPITGNLGWPERRTTMQAIRQKSAQLDHSIMMLPEPGPILASMYLQAMGQMPSGPLVLVLHGSEILRCALLPHRRSLFGNLLKRATRIGVISKYTRKLLLRHYPFAAEKTCLVPGGLRSDFELCPKAVENNSRCTVLSVGRLHPRKGQHCLLEAAELLPGHIREQLKLCFAGPETSPEYFQRLKTMAADLGVEVEFTGEVPDEDLPKLYAKADIFALTSQRTGPSVEGFGLVAIEAGASGLPVLAHRIGGIPEAVRDGQTGLVVNPHKRADLAAALEKLITQPELRKELGQNGIERAKALSWQRNVDILLGG